MHVGRPRWFLRGFGAAILLCGTLNAASYFVRSEHGGDLAGFTPANTEALGFPWQMWQKGENYDGDFVDYRVLALNGLFASGIGAVLGLSAVRYRRRLDLLWSELESRSHGEGRWFQFSTRGLMGATTAAAVAAAAAKYIVVGRPEVLLVIFLLGPALLTTIACLPRRLDWRQRVGMLIPLSFGLIAFAVAAGALQTPPILFDKVLLGIFICWTPQGAVAAGIICGVTLYRLSRETKQPSMTDPVRAG